MAGATLSKGLIGVVLPGGSLVVYSLVTRDFALWRRLHLASRLALFLALAAPWFVAVSRANDEFFRFFFIHEHFERFLTDEHRRVGAVVVFRAARSSPACLPWLVAARLGLRRLWRDGARRATASRGSASRSSGRRSCSCSSALSGSKLPSYILPMFPPLALVAGVAAAAPGSTRTLARLTLPAADRRRRRRAGASCWSATSRSSRRFADRSDSRSRRRWRFGPWLKAALAIARPVGRRRRAASRSGARGGPRPDACGAGGAGARRRSPRVQLALAGYDDSARRARRRAILRAAAAGDGPFAARRPLLSCRTCTTRPCRSTFGRTTTFVALPRRARARHRRRAAKASPDRTASGSTSVDGSSRRATR